MNYYYSRLRQAKSILESYDYPQPFSLHLKRFFKANKQFGSKDRKQIAELCYAYWRQRRIWESYKLEHALLLSSFCWFELHDEAWNKLAVEYELEFTWPAEYEQMKQRDRLLYAISHLNAPADPFYKADFVPEDLRQVSLDCLHFRPKLWVRDLGGASHYLSSKGFQQSPELAGAYWGESQTLENRADVQVQDFSSQWMLSKVQLKKGQTIWDCCCGSGGKSIPLLNSDNKFYLSDLRPAIIESAKKRLKHHNKEVQGIGVHHLLDDKDLKFGKSELKEKPSFDVVIADVPCSGSGTWFRNPEHFANFDYSQLSTFAQRQKRILHSIIPYVKEEGQVYYITCSVFEQENQEVIRYAEKDLGLIVENTYELNGLEHQSDSMFMAVLTKSQLDPVE